MIKKEANSKKAETLCENKNVAYVKARLARPYAKAAAMRRFSSSVNEELIL